ncbi:MAG TPA: hypothetical protein ENK18_09300 [Deltaproteobacteria bacterium]|nr:hypothetical protein [Deltaproteobacteria bacterium]
MANLLLTRERVHAWSEGIGAEPDNHSSAITRLLKDQRRLSRFVEENAQSMQGVTGGVAMYLVGVILRMFDLAGGRMRKVSWDDVRSAERRIGGLVDQLLPVDDDLPTRARQVARAQPHILDEALYALFIRDTKEEEQALDALEAFKVYMLMWVATEALDANWQPPGDLQGETSYTYTPISEDTGAAGA